MVRLTEWSIPPSNTHTRPVRAGFDRLSPTALRRARRPVRAGLDARFDRWTPSPLFGANGRLVRWTCTACKVAGWTARQLWTSGVVLARVVKQAMVFAWYATIVLLWAALVLWPVTLIAVLVGLVKLITYLA